MFWLRSLPHCCLVCRGRFEPTRGCLWWRRIEFADYRVPLHTSEGQWVKTKLFVAPALCWPDRGCLLWGVRCFSNLICRHRATLDRSFRMTSLPRLLASCCTRSCRRRRHAEYSPMDDEAKGWYHHCPVPESRIRSLFCPVAKAKTAQLLNIVSTSCREPAKGRAVDRIVLWRFRSSNSVIV